MLKNILLPKTRWAIVFSFISMFMLGLSDNIRGPLFPEVLNYFGVSNVLGSWSFATTSSAAFLASYFSVYLLKKISLADLLILAAALMSLGLFIMGYAPQFNLFILGSFVLGSSIGFMGVSQNLMVSESVPEDRKPQALSGLHAIYGLASFAAPLLASGSAIHWSTWRAAFLICSALCLIYCIIQFFTGSQPRFEVHKIDLGAEDKTEIPMTSLLLMGGLFAFYVVAEILLATRLALYMRNYFEMDLQASSQYVTYFFLFLLIGRFIFAIKKMPFSIKSQLNASLILSFILLAIGLKSHPFVLTLVGLTMAPFYPLSVSYITDITGSHARKFLTFAMGFQSLAVVSMHLGVGYLTDQLGLFYAFGVGLIALLLSLVCLNIHPKKLY